jgi:hypothetical protein
VSFSADATVAVTYFARQTLKAYFRLRSPPPPESLAQARAIDMSIQFLLFWTPFLTLLGWWTNKPMTLLFGRRHMPSTSIPVLKKTRRSIRSYAPRRRVLPRELCHGRRQDQLGRGQHPHFILRYDRAFLRHFDHCMHN